MVLSIGEVQQHLAGLTYRPGWALAAYEGRWEGHHVVITTRVEDAYRPGEMTTLDVHSPLPPMETVEQLDVWLAWRLGRVELHESREWLRRDGRPLFDPHGPDADRDQ